MGSDDCSWSLHDISKGLLLTKIRTEAAVTSIQFHPDSLVLGVGLANGKVLLYDIRTQEKAIEFDGPLATPVRQLLFSNKGYHLAVSWDGSDICRVYQMHKQN